MFFCYDYVIRRKKSRLEKILPALFCFSTTTKVNSMFGMSGDVTGGGTGGGSIGDDITPVTELKRNGTIPEGGVYYKGGELCENCGQFGVKNMPTSQTCQSLGNNCSWTNLPTATYTEGELFPFIVGVEDAYGDIYIEGDYKYEFFIQETQSYGKVAGWNVEAMENKSSYGDIISEINGYPVICAFNTFSGCSRLTIAPLFPNTVKSMNQTFIDCISLKTYEGSMDSDGDFSNYKLPNNCLSLGACFFGCKLLTVAPVIPDSVDNMSYAFANCTSLIKAPIIPENLHSLSSAFEGCTSLCGSIEVNCDTWGQYVTDFIKGTQITEITGSCSQVTKDELMATK